MHESLKCSKWLKLQVHSGWTEKVKHFHWYLCYGYKYWTEFMSVSLSSAAGWYYRCTFKHENSMQTNLYWTRNSCETARVSAGMNGDWFVCLASVCIDFISCTIHRPSRRDNQNQFRSAAAVKPRLTGTYLDTPL